MNQVDQTRKSKPLEGVRVLEMGQLLAGPFACSILAWFGAEVIKVEPPSGDAIRSWRQMYEGTSLWWYSLGRNKKCITLDLRKPQGMKIARQLVSHVDVLVENFTPGTMEKWGLGYEELRRINSRLIMTRVSGWGQTGPYSHKRGYASIAEAVGGLRYVNGSPDRAPVRPNLSLGDSLAGLHGALGTLLALYHRDVGGSKKGQMVDVAIYESIFNMMESIVPEYDKLGVIRERQGSTLSGIVPTGTYPSQDGKFIVIGANGDSIFKRLCHAMGRLDMETNASYSDNTGRVEYQETIEDAIISWTSQHTAAEIQEALERAEVPVGQIYSVSDMVKDPHFVARELFETASLPDKTTVKLPTMVPKLTDTPGGTEWIGAPVGAHNREVLGGLLGLSDEDMQDLANEGVIASPVTTNSAAK